MNEPNKEYLKMIKEKMPKTKHFSTMFRAFLVGGIICCIGQAITDIYTLILTGNTKEDIAAFTTITLIFITAVLTGFGIYDKIGAFGGAGSIVPITGFANSVVSAAEEHRTEGIVLGLSSNMFSIAGPVIVFGISASVAVGIIVLIFKSAFV
ncbi:MAG: stage V sporulation protein AC [Clostridia bacterium]